MNWKIVSTLPTEEMEEAVEHIADDRDYHEDIYCCMIAAAPRASEDETLVERVANVIQEAACEWGDLSRRRQARAVLKPLEGHHG